MEKYDTGETRISRQTSADAPLLTPPKSGEIVEDIIGQILDERFRIVESIGQGGMSAVFKADHLLLERPVAVKLLQKQLCTSAETILRFQREARALSTLDHRNVVKVHAFGVTPGGNSYLVMDYIHACNLSEYIKETGPLPVAKALPLFKSICEGLTHIHNRGVVHRDIKPANIVLAENEDGTSKPVIVDFGIATIEQGVENKQRLTEAGSTCGSPPYMSPEQCLGHKADARSDIYSLGCLFFEVMTGRCPFTGSTGLDIIMKHMNETAPRFHQVLAGVEFSDSLEAIVQKCLAKNPEERYPDVAELLRDLHQVGTGSEREDTIGATLPSEKVKSAPKAVVSLVVIASIAVLIIGVGIAFFFSPQGKTMMLRRQVEQLLARPDAKFPEVQQRMMELAADYETAGNKVEAERVLRDLGSRARHSFPADSREYAGYFIEMSKWFRARGNDAAAVAAASRGIDALAEFAVKSMNEGDYLAQKTALNECIDLCKQTGQPKEKVMPFMFALSTYYKSAGRYRAAEALAKPLLDLSNSMAESPQKQTSVMMARNILGEIYVCERRFNEALPLLVDSENIALDLFGRYHATHKTAVRTLANCYQQMGNTDLATRLLNSIQ